MTSMGGEGEELVSCRYCSVIVKHIRQASSSMVNMRARENCLAFAYASMERNCRAL